MRKKLGPTKKVGMCLKHWNEEKLSVKLWRFQNIHVRKGTEVLCLVFEGFWTSGIIFEVALHMLDPNTSIFSTACLGMNSNTSVSWSKTTCIQEEEKKTRLVGQDDTENRMFVKDLTEATFWNVTFSDCLVEDKWFDFQYFQAQRTEYSY